MAWKIQRSDILDYETFSEQRDQIQEQVFPQKHVRRIAAGDYLTFLFENHATMRYQIQEILRAEKIVKEASIQHEIDVYNGLLANPGELACALLIGIDEPELRKQKLTEWLGLPSHLYVKLESGDKVYATFDAGQVGEDRLSAVQYLRFDVNGQVPVALGSDLPEFSLEVPLGAEQRQALASDLEAAGTSH